MSKASSFHSVEIFADGSVSVRLDKKIVDNGETIHTARHFHGIPANETMPAGLTRLAAFLDLNGYPDISAQDRAKILSITNAASGASAESALGEA